MQKIATGVTTSHEEQVSLLPDLLLTEKEQLIDFIFPPDALRRPVDAANLKKLSSGALLCPKNDECFKLNEFLMVE